MRESLDQNSGNPRLDSKVDGVVTHCIYLIATGKWRPGSRLPSIRRGEALWNVNRLTIQKAYRRLEGMGLICSRPKSGYYVGRDDSVDHLSRHRYALENVFHEITRKVQTDLELSALGVFRYLARMAEIEFSGHPEFLFAECTLLQARGHAREIQERLSIPVMAMATGDIDGKRARIPAHVRTVFTTYFHYSELLAMGETDTIRIVPVHIEVSPELTDCLSSCSGLIYFLEIEDVQASQISRDSQSILNSFNLETRVVSDVPAAMKQIFSDDPDAVILLSPRLWGSVSEHWRNHPSVKLVEFKICASAWQTIADRAGLPLGDIINAPPF